MVSKGPDPAGRGFVEVGGGRAAPIRGAGYLLPSWGERLCGFSPDLFARQAHYWHDFTSRKMDWYSFSEQGLDRFVAGRHVDFWDSGSPRRSLGPLGKAAGNGIRAEWQHALPEIQWRQGRGWVGDSGELPTPRTGGCPLNQQEVEVLAATLVAVRRMSTCRLSPALLQAAEIFEGFLVRHGARPPQAETTPAHLQVVSASVIPLHKSEGANPRPQTMP